MTGWKVLTHDYRPPIQGGTPVWDGTIPYRLPDVPLDTSDKTCAAGWNFCATAATALRIAGLWSDGWPARLLRVEGGPDTIRRGYKLRSSQLTILRPAHPAELVAAVAELSRPFGEHAARMAGSQLAWCRALARPSRDPARVEAGLRETLELRGLGWGLRQHPTGWDARAAWTAWYARDARAARDARDAWTAWAGWHARDAWDAWKARAWAARAGWHARDAWAAWTAWSAWTARDALTVEYASLQGWVDCPPDLLTRGIRDAYEHGLAVAVPGPDGTLEWAMAA